MPFLIKPVDEVTWFHTPFETHQLTKSFRAVDISSLMVYTERRRGPDNGGPFSPLAPGPRVIDLSHLPERHLNKPPDSGRPRFRRSKKNPMDTNPSLSELMSQLTDHEGPVRERARHALVKIGTPAVPLLIEALTNKNKQLRWEACKALGGIKDPKASAPLVGALEDESMEIRWLAAEGLIAVGRHGIAPLLEALVDRSDSIFLRQGAHHVLHALEKEGLLKPQTMAVLDALRTLEAESAVPLQARKALNALQ